MDKTPVLPQIIFTAVVVAAALYAALCVVLFFTQRSLIYFPQPRALPDHASRMVLQTGGATLVLTTRPVAGRKAVIYFGGNAEDVSSSLPTLADAFPEHALYLLHYRGYGGSTGRPTEAALHADALAVFDHVHADHPEITIIGRSLGSGLATRLASVRAAARLVLVTPYDSMQRLAQKSLPYIPVRWLLRDKYDSWRDAGRIATLTTLVVAEHDEFIPMENSRRLHASFPEGVARTIVIPRTGHNSISDSPAYIPALRARSPDCAGAASLDSTCYSKSSRGESDHDTTSGDPTSDKITAVHPPMQKYISLIRSSDDDRQAFRENFPRKIFPELARAMPGLSHWAVNIVDGVPRAPGQTPATVAELPYDAVVETWFAGTVNAADAQRALSRLNAPTWRVTESIEKDEPRQDGAPPRAKLFSLINPVAGLSDDEFRRHWNEHVPIALRVHRAGRQYVRHLVEESFPADAPRFRGVGMIGMDNRKDLEERMFDTPAGREEVAVDTAEFVGSRMVLFTTEHWNPPAQQTSGQPR